MTKTIRKLLVANRGEIARRVFRSAKAMGIGTVAVYSEADAGMPFVRDADEAVCIGPAPSRESYLAVEKILDAARRTGADAIHPGYGFLSENAAFAEACAAAGLVFVGPPPSAIRAMGLKREAKITAEQAGVPVVPGALGGDERALAKRAEEMGYPVLLKASAGGGGKGMRIVSSAAELAEQIAGARREALAAFGDDTLILEKYIERLRHVEIQIFGDAHGNVVHLFERECSVQRRYQKIVEESPSPALTPARRAEMGEAAVRLAKAIGYQNAGTVEFILAPDGAFYFLEVNTRLQVEHPVTECVTGLDLVREQLRVAEGHPLSFTQASLAQRGAAIEVRVYAEDPGEGNLPQSGVLSDWHVPEAEGVRVESGVETGSEVGIHYDPMLAKVIGFGADREEARRRLVRTLEQTSIAGLKHNRDLLLAVLRHQDFVLGNVDTHFLETRFAAGLHLAPSSDAVAGAVVAASLAGWYAARGAGPLPTIPLGFRNNRFAPERRVFAVGGRGTAERQAVVSFTPVARDGFVFEVAVGDAPTRRLEARFFDMGGAALRFEMDGVTRTARVTRSGLSWTVLLDGALVTFDEAPRFPEKAREVTPGGYLAPMPGKVQALRVKQGDEVAPGDVLLVLEAMKMEHTIRATEAGRVAELRVDVGEQVAANQTLLVIHAAG